MDGQETLPGLLLPGNLPIVVHAPAGVHHGRFRRSMEAEVGPQGGSKETHAADHDGFVLQEVECRVILWRRPCRRRVLT